MQTPTFSGFSAAQAVSLRNPISIYSFVFLFPCNIFENLHRDIGLGGGEERLSIQQREESRRQLQYLFEACRFFSEDRQDL